MTNQTPAAGGDLVEMVARAIAEALGDDFDDAHENKSQWVKMRGEGQKGSAWRDCNAPMQGDFLAASDAAIKAISTSDAGYRQLFDDLFCGRNFQVSIGGNPILVERMLDRIDELQHALQEPKP